MSVFAAAADAIYGNPNFGEAAVYTPLSGSPVAVTIIWTAPEEGVSLVGMSTRLARRLARVRTAEIAEPQKGASLTVGGHSYTIGDRDKDALGIEWTLDLKGS